MFVMSIIILAAVFFLCHSQVGQLITTIKNYDSDRIVTVSSTGGHLDDTANIDAEVSAGVNLIAPHLSRTSDWYSQTQIRTEAIKDHLASQGLNLPVYLQEEQAYPDDSTGSHFVTALTQACQAHAAGWTFHNRQGMSFLNNSQVSMIDDLGPQQSVLVSLGNVNLSTCSPGAALTVTATANPNSITTGNSSILTATVMGGTAPYSYSWNPGGNAGNSITVTPTVTTNYTVTVTDASGTTATAQVTVTVGSAPPSPLTASASASPSTISVGSNSTLTASATGGTAPYTYHWNNGQTGATIMVSPSATTNYTVTVTDAAGASTTAQVTVSVGGGGVCGNGTTDTGEGCDDGNTTSGDGCSSTCQIEVYTGFEWCNADNSLCKMGTGRTPAVAMDGTGKVHISYDCNCTGGSSFYPDYDNSSCHNICYRSWDCSNGISSETVIGNGWGSRIAVDHNNLPHVVYQIVGNSGWDAIGYNKLTATGNWQFGTGGTTLVTMDQRIDKPRIIVNQNNQVFVSFSDCVTGGWKVAYVDFNADSGPFSYLSQNARLVTNGVKLSNGGLAFDGDGDIHFQWAAFDTPNRNDRGLYYARRNQASGAIEDIHQISSYASNFSDIAAEATGNRVYGVGQGAWGSGLFFTSGNNRLENASLIFNNTPNEVGPAAIDGDFLMTDLVVDKTNTPYITWTGYRNRNDSLNRMTSYCEVSLDGNCGLNNPPAGSPPNSNTPCQSDTQCTSPEVCLKHEGIVQNCTTECMPNECHDVRWPIAYYTKMNNNTPGVPTEVVNETTLVAAGEPAMTTRSRQGSKGTNPQSAAALNQGIITAFEYAIPPEPYSIYFRMIDGANICYTPPSSIADLNCDGMVDVKDLGILLSFWLKTSNLNAYQHPNCTQSKNLDMAPVSAPDALININDIGRLLSCWGTANNPACQN